MPVAVIKANKKLAPFFPYPPSGRVRVYLEASLPVDVFISNPEQAKAITSVQTAAEFSNAVLIRNLRWQLDEIVQIPPAWNTMGWTLTIGHPGGHEEPIGVYYNVYQA